MRWEKIQTALLDLEAKVGEGNIVQVTIKGRNEAQISCSVPDGPIPTGWRRAGDGLAKGWQRIIWEG